MIIYSTTFLRLISWTMKIGAIALWPVIIIRTKYKDRSVEDLIINHERIHLEQQKELLVIPFYIIYLLNYAYNIITLKKDPYKSIIFEKEAYQNQNNLQYLKTRKRYNYFKT